MFDIQRGANIIIDNWVRLKPWQKLLIVTSSEHVDEAEALRSAALRKSSHAEIMLVENSGIKTGAYFDEHGDAFLAHDVIIGATDYSLVTTKAVKNAIARHKGYLSLPLSTTDGIPMLSYDFLTMDTKKSKLFAQVIMRYLNPSSFVRVTTPNGTDLRFSKRNRPAGFFNGVISDGNGYSSSSIEVYIPIEETKTEGTMVVDASLGYIGKADEPTALSIEHGKITGIEGTPTGRRLESYIESYHDDRVRVAGELGIGLNSKSRCAGTCYIEDESTYGTFHIGFGRNLALGGIHEASGHFDLVCDAPDIYVDNRQIMSKGRIITPEPEVY